MRMVESELAELETALGHHFRRPEWLERALTHSSSVPELNAARLPQDDSGKTPGEIAGSGREKPAVLADAYEAVLAAIYLDAGLEAARGFLWRSLLEEAVGEEAHRLGQPDHKSGLQELLQGRGLGTADYRVVSEIGPDHRKTFVVAVSVAGQVLASGAGANKKEAEQAAARQALERLLGAKELGKEEHGRSDSPRGN